MMKIIILFLTNVSQRHVCEVCNTKLFTDSSVANKTFTCGTLKRMIHVIIVNKLTVFVIILQNVYLFVPFGNTYKDLVFA